MLPFLKHADVVSRSEHIGHVFRDQLYIDIVRSDLFRRLKSVSFLGTIEYILRPSSVSKYFVHNRFNHSIGVAKLALEYSKYKLYSKEKERNLVVYALLHDIGHFPFSHSIESVFKKNFNIDHQIASANLIQGKIDRKTEIKEILDLHGVSDAEIVKYFNAEECVDREVSSPFNIDTLEGISRSFSALGRSYVRPDPARLLKNTLLSRSKIYRDLFWENKAQIYNKIINGPVGAAADILSSLYFSEFNIKLDVADMIISDRDFFAKYPDFVIFMRDASDFLLKRKLVLPAPIKRRDFFIESAASVEADERYQSKKGKQDFNLDAWRSLFYRMYWQRLPSEMQLELFNDGLNK